MKHNIEGGNPFAFICEDINDLEHSAQLNLPRVSVVMPLKGFGEHNLQNWRSQVSIIHFFGCFSFSTWSFSCYTAPNKVTGYKSYCCCCLFVKLQKANLSSMLFVNFSMLLLLFCHSHLLLFLIRIYLITDHFSLRRTSRVHFCSRKYWWSCIQCCISTNLRVQGKHKPSRFNLCF